MRSSPDTRSQLDLWIHGRGRKVGVLTLLAWDALSPLGPRQTWAVHRKKEVCHRADTDT